MRATLDPWHLVQARLIWLGPVENCFGAGQPGNMGRNQTTEGFNQGYGLGGFFRDGLTVVVAAMGSFAP